MAIFNIDGDAVLAEAEWIFENSEGNEEDKAQLEYLKSVSSQQIDEVVAQVISSDEDYYYAAWDRALNGVMETLIEGRKKP